MTAQYSPAALAATDGKTVPQLRVLAEEESIDPTGLKTKPAILQRIHEVLTDRENAVVDPPELQTAASAPVVVPPTTQVVEHHYHNGAASWLWPLVAIMAILAFAIFAWFRPMTPVRVVATGGNATGGNAVIHAQGMGSGNGIGNNTANGPGATAIRKGCQRPCPSRRVCRKSKVRIVEHRVVHTTTKPRPRPKPKPKPKPGVHCDGSDPGLGRGSNGQVDQVTPKSPIYQP